MSTHHLNDTGPRVQCIPEGDDRCRLICPECGYIAYENPRIVIGAVCRWNACILLCRRAIEPRRGYWTLPAGYLELNESVEDGVRREAWEEARAELTLGPLLAVYSITRINLVQIIFRARLLRADVRPGPESSEVCLFRWDEIPFAELAFPSVRWALEHDRRAEEGAAPVAASNPEPEVPRKHPPL
ncbi:MAG: NUDIX hydrolase [Nitrococcus mobilis]|nr:NUDIX hydrolase [Nitrococcus mobilis]